LNLFESFLSAFGVIILLGCYLVASEEGWFSYFFLSFDALDFFGMTCPVALYDFGITTLSAKEKSTLAPPLLSSAAYPFPLYPQLTS